MRRLEALPGPLDAAAVNAGVGVNSPLVESDLDEQLRLIGLNVTGAVHFTRRVLPGMVERGRGRLLFTSSIAATMPGPYLSTYAALQGVPRLIRRSDPGRAEGRRRLRHGPPARAHRDRVLPEGRHGGHQDGQAPKDYAAEVARVGFEAMMAGKDHVVAGSVLNRAQTAMARVLPDKVTGALHGVLSKPGSASPRPS